MLSRQRRIRQPQIRPLTVRTLRRLLQPILLVHVLAHEEEVRQEEDVSLAMDDWTAGRRWREGDLDCYRASEVTGEGERRRVDLQPHHLQTQQQEKSGSDLPRRS